MVYTRVTVEGTARLASELRKLGDKKRIINVVQHHATEGQRHSQRIAPVDTGNLKRMIFYYNEDGGYTGRWASEAEYAAAQEYGTRRQRGTPHIKPSFDRTKVQFIKDMGRAISGKR